MFSFTRLGGKYPANHPTKANKFKEKGQFQLVHISVLLPRKGVFSIAACGFVTEKSKPSLELMFKALKHAGLGRQLKGMYCDGEDSIQLALHHPECFPGVQTWLCDYHDKRNMSNALFRAGTAYSKAIKAAITALVDKMRVTPASKCMIVCPNCMIVSEHEFQSQPGSINNRLVRVFSPRLCCRCVVPSMRKTGWL